MFKVISNGKKGFFVEKGETICAKLVLEEGVNSVKTIVVNLFEGEGEDVLKVIISYLFPFGYVWDMMFIYGADSENERKLVKWFEAIGSYWVEAGGGRIELRPARKLW